MQVLYTRCAGLDVHKDTIVACVRCVSPPIHQEVRSFGSTTTELLALADWLAEHGCTHVAMEATGVYWKPVWHVLEDEFELVLANAAHIRNVPGRKTDVNDAMWIADLLAHGLIRSSFVPPQAIQQLRDLTRTTMLKLHLQIVDALERTLTELDTAVGKALAPIRQRARLLTTMPGVSDLTASVLVAEIGVDMTRFPSAGHLISWAGLCPRSDESAGKRRSTRVRKSGTWLKTALVTAAWAAVRVKTSYLRAQFLRIKARRGAKKAILAVAASMLTAAFHMLREGTEYADLGSEHFDRQDKSKTIRRLLKRLQDLGCHVAEPAHAM